MLLSSLAITMKSLLIPHDTHGDYPGAVRKLAEELNVPLLDMHEKTEKMIVDHGVEDSKKIFLFIDPGVYKSRPDGLEAVCHPESRIRKTWIPI